MRILIIGSSGQLGGALLNSYKDQDEIELYSISRTSPEHSQPIKKQFLCDLQDEEKVKSIFKEIRPDIVINAAALTNADICETEKEAAYAINVQANKTLLNLASVHGSFYVFISTYYVFDGSHIQYSEDDSVSPINYYAQTKVDGEKDSLGYNRSLIIRPSKIISIGYDQRNFLARTIDVLRQNKEISIVDDQYTNPITADVMAEDIKLLLEKNKKGIYHVGGNDYVSNYEMALQFAECFGLNKKLIIPIHTDVASQTAQRPKTVHLLLDKLRNEHIKTYDLNDMLLWQKQKEMKR